jgi:hypothetical protein
MPGPGYVRHSFHQRMRQEPVNGGERWARPWWRGAVFYQIYVRSSLTLPANSGAWLDNLGGL